MIPLGCDVDDEHVEARLDKGVLVVRQPKSEKSRARTIQIENG